MSARDEILAANDRFAAGFDAGDVSGRPERRFAVVTCMDVRVVPLHAFGIELGDANVIRNAGATVSDDVLRSLHAAESVLGVSRAIVIGHTDCAGHGSDAAATAGAADSARRIRNAMPDSFTVDAFMYDVATGVLSPVQAP